MTFGSLFAGIGGFDLGLERAGMTCEWQVEIDPYARRILEKHWPDVRRWDDVRTFPPGGNWGVDLICGGFPCQDISIAGPCTGLAGERSGLWSEFARIIRVLRPDHILIENVAAFSFRGLATVLGDLAAVGYDAEWSMLSACAMDAPHVRQRLFIHAYADREHGTKGMERQRQSTWKRKISRPYDPEHRRAWRDAVRGADRGGNGIPARMDRLRCLGNAVVPQVAEWIGRRIMEAESSSTA
jgi:DNA (cytosine-5)-methyltransferase 1